MNEFVIVAGKTSYIQMKSREYIRRHRNTQIIKMSVMKKTTNVRGIK